MTSCKTFKTASYKEIRMCVKAQISWNQQSPLQASMQDIESQQLCNEVDQLSTLQNSNVFFQISDSMLENGGT